MQPMNKNGISEVFCLSGVAMLKQFIILSSFLLVAVVSEAPYPASGWKPEGSAFDLPRDYLPPQEEQLKKFDFEISKQHVDYIGQLRENPPTNQPKESYLPPQNPDDTDIVQDVLRVQGLPNRNTIQFRPIFSRPESGQFSRPAQTFKFPSQFSRQQRPQVVISPPAEQYEVPRERQTFSPESHNVNSEEKRNAIKALNAAVNAYNRDHEKEANTVGYDYPSEVGKVTKGQYYVLGPDNTLQRVTFSTTQDEEDIRRNGFTAQLKYTPVGEIRDPVFKYNDKGQLVRIFKK